MRAFKHNSTMRLSLQIQTIKHYFWNSSEVLVLCFILLFLAGISDAVQDTLVHHYSTSIFPQNQQETTLGAGPNFWNPELSWKNKYKDWDGGIRTPRFPLATTALVFLTDAWHLFQFLTFTLYQAAMFLLLWHAWHVREYPYPSVRASLNRALLPVPRFIIFGLLFIAVCKLVFGASFTIFYNHILIH